MKKKPEKKPLYPSQGLKKKVHKVRDPNVVGPTEVATIIGESYQTARNMMLRGVFGEAKYDEVNRSLSVQRGAVIAYNSVKKHGGKPAATTKSGK